MSPAPSTRLGDPGFMIDLIRLDLSRLLFYFPISMRGKCKANFKGFKEDIKGVEG